MLSCTFIHLQKELGDYFLCYLISLDGKKSSNDVLLLCIFPQHFINLLNKEISSGFKNYLIIRLKIMAKKVKRMTIQLNKTNQEKKIKCSIVYLVFVIGQKNRKKKNSLAQFYVISCTTTS